jgi:hypothetical protein
MTIITKHGAVRRWITVRGAPLLLAGLLGACASLIGPRQVDLPQERLQHSMERRFPLHQRALGILDVELSNPQLTILDQNDRVSLSLDANVAPLLARQSWNGSMAISGRLAVDRARNAVYLTDAHVDRFVFDGLDEGRQHQVASIANLLSEKVVREMPIYTFRPEDLRYAGMQFALTGIGTKPGALVATMEPAQ